MILKSAGADLLSFGGWGIGFIPILLAYGLIFKFAPSSDLRPAYFAIGLILGLQAIGYYGIYLITPYDLQWHIDFSIGRLVLQLYIPFLFLFFTIVSDVETALAVK